MHRYLCVVLLVLSVLTGSCGTKKLYVSPAGDDSYSGSMAKPVATLAKAVETARHVFKKNINIIIGEGTYYLEKPIVITPSKKRIRFVSAENGKVVISGGVALTNLEWKPCGDGIMQTSVCQNIGYFDQLFVNGKKQIMARYPNYDESSLPYNGTAADAVSVERAAGWSKPEGGFVHALHKAEWGGYHWQIKGRNADGELVLEGGYQNNRQMGMHRSYRFVENIFEELDSQGEWFYDKDSKILYFYPPENVDVSSALFEVPQVKELIVIKGTVDEPVKNVTIKGLEFTHTLRTFMDTKEPLLRSDWAIARTGAVFMEGAENCVIEDCVFNAVGGNAVFFSRYNNNNMVTGCHIYNIGAGGVSFVGDPADVRSPSFEYNDYVSIDQLDTIPGPKGNNFPRECRVVDNLIHDIGRVEKQVAGVQISMSKDIVVSHNSIYNTPRAGINISEGTWGGHIIEYNDVFNTVLETGDHGSFNSWGRDRYWHPNRDSMNARVAEYPEYILLDAVKTTIITNNRFRCDHGWDIDLDDGSSNYHIYNNVCLHGGIKLREGFYRTVDNNIMINNSFHPHVWFKNSGDIFSRNIVTAPYFPIRLTDWGTEVDYNLFPDEASLKKAQAEGTDAHSAFGNPDFFDADNGDYRIKFSSKALRLGFRNFDMNGFGVMSNKLKVLAEKPEIPELIAFSVEEDRSAEQEMFGGMEVRNIITEGDRSAAGLSEISGVWVLDIQQNSMFDGLLRNNDVIVAFNNRDIRNIRDLRKVAELPAVHNTMVVMRNQKEVIVNW